MNNGSLYEFEAWSATGLLLADISALVSNVSYTLVRNDAEQLTFTIDLFAFEAYCRDVLGGINPRQLISPYQTDIKVKRAGVYLFGTQVVDVAFTTDPDEQEGETVDLTSPTSSGFPLQVTCTGYLNLFKDRYLSIAYTQKDRTAICTDLITRTQAQSNGSVGVTIGSQYVPGAPTDRTYSYSNVKTEIQNLAALSDYPFDFAFTYDKQFQTFAQIGAVRADINLIWGGPSNNVAGFSLDRSALNLFNKVYGLGSGIGDAQLVSVQADPTSELNYYLRESVMQYSTVEQQSTLDQDTFRDMNLAKDLLALPVISITTADIPSTFLNVGDRIPLAVEEHPYFDDINGLYRIEQIVVNLDENNWESIELTFDDFGVT